MMMSFSKEYIARENLPSLSFQLAGRSPEQIMVNKEFISSNGDVHTFDTTKLHQHLKVSLSNCKHKFRQMGWTSTKDWATQFKRLCVLIV